MSTATLFHSLFKYKAWANEEILAKIVLIDAVQHAGERQTALTILNHTYVVDRIFAANLQGLKHEYTAPSTPEIPRLEQLGAAMRDSDQWYIRYVQQLTSEGFSETLDFTFTDGAPGRMSREEMLAHVVLHGGGHRGAIGRVLLQASIKPPKDVFTGFLHKAEAASRRR